MGRTMRLIRAGLGRLLQLSSVASRRGDVKLLLNRLKRLLDRRLRHIHPCPSGLGYIVAGVSLNARRTELQRLRGCGRSPSSPCPGPGRKRRISAQPPRSSHRLTPVNVPSDAKSRSQSLRSHRACVRVSRSYLRGIGGGREAPRPERSAVRWTARREVGSRWRCGREEPGQ